MHNPKQRHSARNIKKPQLAVVCCPSHTSYCPSVAFMAPTHHTPCGLLGCPSVRFPQPLRRQLRGLQAPLPEEPKGPSRFLKSPRGMECPACGDVPWDVFRFGANTCKSPAPNSSETDRTLLTKQSVFKNTYKNIKHKNEPTWVDQSAPGDSHVFEFGRLTSDRPRGYPDSV